MVRPDYRLTLVAAIVSLTVGGILFTFVTPWEQSGLAGFVLIALGLAFLLVAVRQARRKGTRPASNLAFAIGATLIAAFGIMLWAGLPPIGGDLDILPALIVGVPAALVGAASVAWGWQLRRSVRA